MKKRYRIVSALLAFVLLGLALSTTASANSAEPPGFTVVVTNPPEDLTLSLELPDGTTAPSLTLRREQKAWEVYYRFYWGPAEWDGTAGEFTLIAESEDGRFACPLPDDLLHSYNNLLTLDLKSQTVTLGQSPLRIATLVALRVVLTLLIEGAVFFLFGYRTKRSWAVFLILNLITQGCLNLLLTGSGTGFSAGLSVLFVSYLIAEFVIIAVEMIACMIFLKEHNHIRAGFCALAANLASLVLGGILITYLPV